MTDRRWSVSGPAYSPLLYLACGLDASMPWYRRKGKLLTGRMVRSRKTGKPANRRTLTHIDTKSWGSGAGSGVSSPSFRASKNDEQLNMRRDIEHPQYGEIRSDIVALVQTARAASARSVNALMTTTYWDLGRCIVEFEHHGQERAEYAEAITRQLSGFESTCSSSIVGFAVCWSLTSK